MRRSSSVEQWGDPIGAVLALVDSSLFPSYVAYTTPTRMHFAGGVCSEVTLDSRHLRIMHNGQHRIEPIGPDPLRRIGDILNDLTSSGRRAYGYLAFELAHVLQGSAGRDERSILAQFVIPQAELLWRSGEPGPSITCADGPLARRITRILGTVRRPGLPEPTPVPLRRPEDRVNYETTVAHVVQAIRDGHLRKAIVSRTVPLPFELDMPRTYALGMRSNTPARSFLLNIGGIASAGFSPEIVATVDSDRRVQAQPLAGTRPLRTDQPELSAVLREELEWDVKECYEHVISVRLVNEEISQVCEPDTVSVQGLMSVVERYTVQHLGSGVAGTLLPGLDAWDALREVFPSVTASGIPKAPALRLIGSIEPDRGLYAGAVCVVGGPHDFDSALVLRSAFTQNGRSWLRAGAGIVRDSIPAHEFDETANKLASISRCLVATEGVPAIRHLSGA